MRRLFAALLACALLALMLSGCACKHEWKEATCTTPRTCTKCGETEGEPLGHDAVWETVSADRVAGTRSVRLKCAVCGEVLETKEEDLDTVVEDGHFTFTPKEFVERLQNSWDKEKGETLALDFPYAVNSEGYLNFDIEYHQNVWLGWGVFYGEDGSAIMAPGEGEPVCAVRIIVGPVKTLEIDSLLTLLHELTGPCSVAVDPSIKDGDLYDDPIKNNTYAQDGKSLNGLHYTCGYDQDAGCLTLLIDIA